MKKRTREKELEEKTRKNKQEIENNELQVTKKIE